MDLNSIIDNSKDELRHQILRQLIIDLENNVFTEIQENISKINDIYNNKDFENNDIDRCILKISRFDTENKKNKPILSKIRNIRNMQHQAKIKKEVEKQYYNFSSNSWVTYNPVSSNSPISRTCDVQTYAPSVLPF